MDLSARTFIRLFHLKLGTLLRLAVVISGLMFAGLAAAQSNATFISQTVPTGMVGGQTYSVTVTMKNTGTTTWTSASNFRLGSQNASDNTTWGTNRVALNSSVVPNQTYSFTFSATAPRTAGTYNFQWEMVQDGVAWFGPLTTNVAIVVTAPTTNNASVASQTVPTTMTTGQTGVATIVMTNTGTTTWTGTGNYSLGSQNPQDNLAFNANRVPVTYDVAPGQQYTFTLPMTAPSTPGTYNLQWEMVQDFVGWFGVQTANVAVTVTAPAGGTLITPPPTSTGTNLPGKTPGKLEVTKGGQASYTIPIAVPPGSNNLVPSVALQYVSGGGNGPMGVGWALGGLSQISRCARDVVHDTAAASVDLSANDKYCIDGQRMLVVTGTYGAANSEYRAEVHNFTKVVASSTLTGTAPTSFTATDRNGIKYEYGTVATARLRLPGEPSATAVVWALNKVTDPRGNYYTITYTDSTTNTGQQLVSRIDYTGNASASLATYNSVQFSYDSARTDVEWQYTSGYKTVRSMRLNSIQTFNGATVVKRYSLAYQTSTPTARSRLASVTECSGSAGPCLPATSFTWEDTPFTTFGTTITYPDPSVEFGSTFSQPAAGVWLPGNSYWNDLNGDGVVDHCRATEHDNGHGGTDYQILFCALSQPSGSPTVVTFTPHYPVKSPYQFIDVNGDGILDVCEGTTGCTLMGANGAIGTINPPIANIAGDLAHWVDVNGDGQPDFCVRTVSTGVLSCALNNGNSTFGAATTLGTFAFSNCVPLGSCATPTFGWANLSGDANWFCRSDTPAGLMRCRKWTAAGLGAEITTASESASTGQWVDVNGDGLADYCRARTDGTVACTLSTGTGFGDTITSAAGAPKQVWIDVNGDGRADVCGEVSTNPGNSTCLLSTGSGFGATVAFPMAAVMSDDGAYAEYTALGLVDANSDGKIDACNSIQCITSSGKASDYLLSVTDGLGAIAGVDYGNLSDRTIYTKGSGASFPIKDVADTTFVVTETHLPNGADGTMVTAYKYEWLKTHAQGLGSFGFGAITSTDPLSSSTRTESSQAFPYVGLPTRVLATNGSTTLSDTTQTYLATAGPAYTIQPLKTVAKTYDLNGAFINWVETTASSFDAYNNPQQVAVVFNGSTGAADGFSSTTAIAYQNDTTNWVLGLPTSVAETRAMTGQPNSTRTTTLSYFASNPGLDLVQQRLDEPTNGGLGVTNLKLTTAFGYDSFGNLTTRTVSGANIATRTEVTNTYDTQGRFATTVANALNQSTVRTFDAALGTMLTSKDPNNLTTTWTYDAFGRVATLVRPDGTQLTYDRKPCVNCIEFSSYETYVTDTVTATGATVAPYQRVYSDALDRPVMIVHAGMSGDVYEQLVYDSVGRLQSRTKPFYNADSAIRWIQFGNDALRRVTQVTAPDGNTGSATSTTTTAYNGRTITRTNNNNVSFAKTINSQGTVVSVVDAQGAAEQSTVTYAYDQWKNLTKTTDNAGNVMTIAYDLRGRRTQIVDPDMGTRNFTSIDNLGQVLTTVDAKSQTTTFTYDLLGRMTSRTEPDLTSNWYYDKDSAAVACANGIGYLCQVTATNGYSRRYVYDTKSRLSSLTSHIDVDYVGSYGYDAAGRLSTKTFPTSTGTSPLSLSFVYDSNGYLNTINDAGSGSYYWMTGGRNSDGKLLGELFGGGYTSGRSYNFNTGQINRITAGTAPSPTSRQDQSFDYDSLGRMKSRGDAILTTSETFAYDALDRLYSTVLTAPGVTGGQQSSAFTYDTIGNISSKSGVGTYSYAAGKPHAVSSVNGTVNGVSMPTYSYDSNGNMSTDGTRSFTWTSFNMPLVISKTATGGSPGSGSASFNYGPEHQRVKQVWTQGAATTTTVYLGEFDFEKVTDSTGTTYRHYIKTDGRIVANVQRGPSSNSTQYLVSDHLSSTSTVIDPSGNVLDRMAYDPWGDRRFASSTVGASDATNTIQPATTNRGYTGHEMLDQGNLGLVHMNGRVYDPTLGRFISADPKLTRPFSTQGFNRYAYVMNAPLDATDPSGFQVVTALQNVEIISSRFYIPLTDVVTFVAGGSNSAPTGWDYVRDRPGSFTCGPCAASQSLSQFGSKVLSRFGVAARLLLNGVPPIAAIVMASGGDDAGGTDVKIDDKIKGQLGDRGWTEQDVQDAAKGDPAGSTTDNRGPTTDDGQRRNDPATVYGTKDGYVVVNDRTREVVQISDRNAGSGWIPDSRIKWNGGN